MNLTNMLDGTFKNPTIQLSNFMDKITNMMYHSQSPNITTLYITQDINSNPNPDVQVMNWGHVTDGNLHINVITPGVFKEDLDVKALLTLDQNYPPLPVSYNNIQLHPT